MTFSRLARAFARARHACVAGGLIGGTMLAGLHAADAHGIAGNRFFPGTLSFDDPAVSDEFSVTPGSVPGRALDDSGVRDNSVSFEFMRLLVPNVAAVVDSGVIYRNWTDFNRSGFDATTLSLKGLLYQSDPHEFMLAAKFSWGIGQSGTAAVDGAQPNFLQPGLYFAKGFGDLPDGLAWLRPFAVAGAFAAEFPTTARSTILGVDATNGGLTPMPNEFVPTLHSGFAIEYSTYYLTSRFNGRPPKEEPLHQFVPLVEFAFDTPFVGKTAANMSPGVSYVAEAWEVTVEAVVPLNAEAGHGVGVRTQLLLFLDDLAPSIFGKPLLSR